jgi:hypothetical protein
MQMDQNRQPKKKLERYTRALPSTNSSRGEDTPPLLYEELESLLYSNENSKLMKLKLLLSTNDLIPALSEVTIQLKPKNTAKYASEHVVLFGTLQSGSRTIEVCLKFLNQYSRVSMNENDSDEDAILPTDEAPDMYQLLPTSHLHLLTFNHNTISNVLERFNQTLKGVRVETCHIYQVQLEEKGTLWLESDITASNCEFVKFWGVGERFEQMLTTKIEVLKNLQRFVYEQSGYQFTLIDIQGVEKVNENLVEYVLSDITFTRDPPSTYTEAMLLTAYVCILVFG